MMAEKKFTKAELAQFDGQNGNKAYVAVDGVVYDVTNVAAWKDGAHHGNKAGNDVTAGLGHSPHGERVLKKLEVVGKLVDQAKKRDVRQGEKPNSFSCLSYFFEHQLEKY